MTGPLPVKGTEISSAPCSVRKAARLLSRFLSSEAALEVGIARGYVEAVAQSLQEILAGGEENSGNGTEGRGRLASAGRSSKFFNIEQAPKVPEVEKKSRKDKKVKQKKKDQAMEKVQAMEKNQAMEKDQAMVDFAALLGHELDGGEIEKQADGELGYEEKPAVTEMLPSTPRQVDSLGDGRESQKSEKHKKKKRKSLGGEAMDVDMVRKAEESDPDNTKSAKKKKKKRKSVNGVISNGSPTKEEAGVARAEDGDVKPGDDVRKKKKKKHRDDASTPTKEESKKLSRRSTSKS